MLRRPSPPLAGAAGLRSGNCWTSPATGTSTSSSSAGRRRASTSGRRPTAGSRSGRSGRRPNIAWDDPNLRFVDLDGDGLADVLITEDDAFTWYPSLGDDGFGPAGGRSRAVGRGAGPAAGASPTRDAVHLPGRHDRRRPGRPGPRPQRRGLLLAQPRLRPLRRQGHAWTDAPWFDQPDLFDQRRVRLADIDGSGTTDIIYLHRDGARLYLNQSGNGWSEPRELLAGVPPTWTAWRDVMRGRPARPRHRVPGLVIAAARRRRPRSCAMST